MEDYLNGNMMVERKYSIESKFNFEFIKNFIDLFGDKEGCFFRGEANFNLPDDRRFVFK